MDNRESEDNNASPPVPNRRATRPPHDNRSLYNNWSTNLRRFPVALAQNTGYRDERTTASNRPDNNRDSHANVEASRNPPIIVNDLLSSRTSNESSNRSRDNRSSHNNHNNSSNNAANNPDSTSVSRDMATNTHGRTRRRNPNVTRAGGNTRSNASMNARTFNNSTSPLRGNSQRQRVPPLRLRGNPSPSRHQDLTDMHSSLHLSSSPEMDLVLPSLSSLSGMGTEEEPFELSAGNGQEDSSTNLTDEEIARQLQQEEWERSNTPAEFGFLPLHSRHPMLGGGRPSRRSLPAQTGEELFVQSLNDYREGPFAPEANRANVNPFALRRTRNGPVRFGDRSHNRHQEVVTTELIPFLFDLFQFHGIPPDSGVLDILNPDRQDLPDDYESLVALAEQLGEVSRGMTMTEINKLPAQKHTVESSSEEPGAACGGDPPQCNICLTEYNEGDVKRMMPCKHEFHMDCVDQWLKTNATCPVCRSDIKLKKS